MSLRSSKNTAADNEIIITPYFRALLSFPAISWRYPDWSLRDTLRPKEVLRSVPLGAIALFYQAKAWGDGQIFADYKCSLGAAVDRYREGLRHVN